MAENTFHVQSLRRNHAIHCTDHLSIVLRWAYNKHEEIGDNYFSNANQKARFTAAAAAVRCSCAKCKLHHHQLGIEAINSVTLQFVRYKCVVLTIRLSVVPLTSLMLCMLRRGHTKMSCERTSFGRRFECKSQCLCLGQN